MARRISPQRSCTSRRFDGTGAIPPVRVESSLSLRLYSRARHGRPAEATPTRYATSAHAQCPDIGRLRRQGLRGRRQSISPPERPKLQELARHGSLSPTPVPGLRSASPHRSTTDSGWWSDLGWRSGLGCCRPPAWRPDGIPARSWSSPTSRKRSAQRCRSGLSRG